MLELAVRGYRVAGPEPLGDGRGAGPVLRELMEYMGHSSLQATERYVKLLPQPAGPDGAADRLNAYLDRMAAAS